MEGVSDAQKPCRTTESWGRGKSATKTEDKLEVNRQTWETEAEVAADQASPPVPLPSSPILGHPRPPSRRPCCLQPSHRAFAHPLSSLQTRFVGSSWLGHPPLFHTLVYSTCHLVCLSFYTHPGSFPTDTCLPHRLGAPERKGLFPPSLHAQHPAQRAANQRT